MWSVLRYVMVSLFAVGIPPVSVVTREGWIGQWRVGVGGRWGSVQVSWWPSSVRERAVAESG
ncbi:hypothetical protein GCM10010329_22610 [Streptomyces spiroverticillatus]|nr:hypothetical protein GCM10010329_22610 [Streptomyces spiroverticillatus]